MTSIYRSLAFPIILLAAPVLAAQPEPKCGVDMPHTTGVSSFDPATIEMIGGFLIEAGLYREGEVGTCVSVHIECWKETNRCDMVEVTIFNKYGPYPEIGPITLAAPMRIAAWTKDGFTAAGDTHLCRHTQLNVDLVHQKVQLVETPRCPPGGPAVIEEVRILPARSMFERKSP